MRYSRFDDFRFKQSVSQAMETVKKVLDADRNPRLAEDVDHTYTNKYEMVDLITNTAIISILRVFDRIGLTKDVIAKCIRDGSDNNHDGAGADDNGQDDGNNKKKQSSAVTLRFQRKLSSKFIEEKNVDLDISPTIQKTTSTTTMVTDTTKQEGGEESEDLKSSDSPSVTTETKTEATKIIQTVTEYHYEVTTGWELSIYHGAAVDKRTVFNERSTTNIMISRTKEPPLFVGASDKGIEVSLSWLFDHINVEKDAVTFAIDKDDVDTRTPRRNKNIDAAISNFRKFAQWGSSICDLLNDAHRRLQKYHNPAHADEMTEQLSTFTKTLAKISDLRDTVPILFMPLMDDSMPMRSTESSYSNTHQQYHLPERKDAQLSSLLTNQDMNALFGEEERRFDEKSMMISSQFLPRSDIQFSTSAEATISIFIGHLPVFTQNYELCVDYVEKMLEKQLVAAIGKTLTADDVDDYVRYQNGNGFLSKSPQSFCYAVRRPGYAPDGTVSIESERGGKSEPIETHVRQVPLTSSVKVPLSAACTVELTGKAFLHGWSRHRFGHATRSYDLVARARQFSSFLLVIGTMTGASAMDPKDAIILENKDTTKIPLILNEIPTAREFKDAIVSLSPDQQRFAKAFRKMQLDSSILAVCVIQIKPQMEVLLGLPDGGLTKQIKLTRDLMDLLVEYQVPSDLLTYDGETGTVSTSNKVEMVKEHAGAILGVIDEAKKKELEDKIMVADMAEAKAQTVGFGNSGQHQAASSSSGAFGFPLPPPPPGCAPPPPPPPHQSAPPPNEMEGFVSSRSNMALSMQYANEPIHDWSGAGANEPFERPGNIRSIPRDGKPSQERASEMASALDWLKSNEASCIDTAAEESLSMSAFKSLTTTSQQASKEVNMQNQNPIPESVKRDPSIDVTCIPRTLDAAIEKHANGCSLRATTIKTSDTWTRSRQENLLTKPETRTLQSKDIKMEKDRAFDLLESLSRSGSLPIRNSEIHVFVCVTHAFEKDIMSTLVQDNINPIEKLEMSTLLMASTIHGVPAQSLITDENDKKRLSKEMPSLLLTDS